MYKLQKNITSLVNKYLRYGTSAIYKELLQLIKRSKLSNEKQKHYQLRKLNSILNHAYCNVPYYNKILTNSRIVKQDAIKLSSIQELNQIPFLTKKIIRIEKESLYSSDLNKRRPYNNTSGGSTGEPVLFKLDYDYKKKSLINWWLVKYMRGVDPFDNEVVLWGAERDIYKRGRSFINKLADFINNRITLNSFKMSESDVVEYINIINREKPKMIRAYAQSIFEIAVYARQNSIDIYPSIAIHSAAGNLFDYMRDEIEMTFNTKVFNHYGTREAGVIATECSDHDGMHIFMEDILVEIVDEEGNPQPYEESGEIVITSLINYSMPLIRYKIGDYGSMYKYSDCSCGCGYDKLKSLKGRTVDLFKTKNNTIVDGEYFTHLLYFKPFIKKFQVVQKDYDNITYKIVLNKQEEVQEDFETEITEKTKLVMGDTCLIEFQYIDEIPQTLTGKHRYTISEI